MDRQEEDGTDEEGYNKHVQEEDAKKEEESSYKRVLKTKKDAEEDEIRSNRED